MARWWAGRGGRAAQTLRRPCRTHGRRTPGRSSGGGGGHAPGHEAPREPLEGRATRRLRAGCAGANAAGSIGGGSGAAPCLRKRTGCRTSAACNAVLCCAPTNACGAITVAITSSDVNGMHPRMHACTCMRACMHMHAHNTHAIKPHPLCGAQLLHVVAAEHPPPPSAVLRHVLAARSHAHTC